MHYSCKCYILIVSTWYSSIFNTFFRTFSFWSNVFWTRWNGAFWTTISPISLSSNVLSRVINQCGTPCSITGVPIPITFVMNFSSEFKWKYAWYIGRWSTSCFTNIFVIYIKCVKEIRCGIISLRELKPRRNIFIQSYESTFTASNTKII